MYRDIELVPARVLNTQIFTSNTFHFGFDQAFEEPDSVIDMNDQLIILQIDIGGLRRLTFDSRLPPWLWPFPPKDFSVAQQMQRWVLGRRKNPSIAQTAFFELRLSDLAAFEASFRPKVLQTRTL